MASTFDVWHVPWIPPPPSETSNLVNPESRAEAYIIICSIFTILMFVFVALRLYVRICILQSLWWDDGESGCFVNFMKNCPLNTIQLRA